MSGAAVEWGTMGGIVDASFLANRAPDRRGPARQPAAVPTSPSFAWGKRAFDVATSVLALPAVGLAALLLMALNPIWNPGPLFYRQSRMGHGNAPFVALKFRTMRCVAGLGCGPSATRGPDDPLEVARITPLGRILRHTRIDELPQFLNVLMGEMSIVGPRPDIWEHAVVYRAVVPGYEARYAVRPGITGLAQVDAGYAEGTGATRLKTRYDLIYIRRRSARLEGYILARTVRVVVTGAGAR